LKRIARILLLGLAMVVTVGPVSAAEYKVGFVNAQKLLENAPQAKAARDHLAKEFKSRDNKLVAMQKALQADQEKLQKNGAVMSEENRRKLERSIIDQKRDVKRSQDDFRDDVNIRRNEELHKLQKTVYDAITAEAKAGKYDLIVGDGVIFASTRVDITDKVLQRLKKQAK